MSSVNKFIAVASLFTAVSLFSQLYSCRYGLIGRLTVNRHVISFLHSPVLLYAVLAFHSVNRCDLYFFQCFLSMYTQYLWPISPIRPISPMQCFYGTPWSVWQLRSQPENMSPSHHITKEDNILNRH